MMDSKTSFKERKNLLIPKGCLVYVISEIQVLKLGKKLLEETAKIWLTNLNKVRCMRQKLQKYF